MKSYLKNILLVTVIVTIPLLVYGYLQLMSLSEDERMAESIYQKQMETVLFSLNQYTDDIMGQWARELSDQRKSLYENVENLVLRNESIQMLSVAKAPYEHDTIFYGDYVQPNEEVKQQIQNWRNGQDSTIQKLEQYYKAGFQKLQGVENWTQQEGLAGIQLPITFMVADADSGLYHVFIIAEARFWTEQILANKIQSLAFEGLNAAVVSSINEEQVFASEAYKTEKEYVQADLWIVPDLQLRIQSAGENYATLVKERSRKNLTFLSVAFGILLLGIILLYRSTIRTLHLAQLKSDFVSNVSHEIRTPLALIKMYAETLMLGRIAKEEKLKEYYQVIYHESGRLTHLVNNILDFSRIEANKKTYHFEKLDLSNLVKGVLDSYQYSFQEKEVELKLELAGGPYWVNGDREALKEVVSNLIDNALKYNDKEVPALEVKLSQQKQEVIFFISDNGPGIPKSEYKRIFERFYRVENALTQQTKGTGMGLSLVQHILQAHQAKITLGANEGAGVFFKIKFPKLNDHE